MGGKNDDVVQTTTQETTIPDFLRPFLDQSTGAASGALGSLNNLLSGAGAEDLVAGFNPDQESAFDLARTLATDPNSPLALATNTFADTAAGGGFSSDAFNSAFDATVRRQQPGIISPFIAAGRGTGGLTETALGQAQSDAFAGLFNQERNRQMQAAAGLPGLAMQPFGLLSGIGQQQQAQEQREIDAPIQAQRDLLNASLSPFGQTAPLFGSTQTSVQPTQSNPLGTALGVGLTGLSLLSGFGGLGALGGLGGAGAAGGFLPGGPSVIGPGVGGGLLGAL